MTLNGIDISSWQQGINVSAVQGVEFAIVKATQGTGYTSPTFAAQVESTLNGGKLLGVYHYVSGGNAAGEAAHFVNTVRPYVGRAVLALDWERDENSAWGNVDYLRQVASEVIRLTGVRPLLYCSQSVLGAVAPVASALNCGLWVAQYADMKPTGWQSSPWNEGAFACAIRQYSSSGTLAGYPGRLDLNKFYGDSAAWGKYAAVNGKPAQQPTPTTPAAKKSVNELASEVIAGKWGTGTERVRRLQAAGYDYKTVQDEVNRKLNPAPDFEALARAVIAGKYGNGQERRNRLGANYDKVMAIVNRMLGAGAPSRVYTVRAGDTLSGIGARLGVSWPRLAQLNGLADPNRIYPGQQLKY